MRRKSNNSLECLDIASRVKPYVLFLKEPKDLIEEFKKIGVDWGGIKIMRPKGSLKAVKISALPVFLANILKQQMLSLGGDAAISRGSITGQSKVTDCIILGTPSQLTSLNQKLKNQPFGFSEIADKISETLENAGRKNYILSLAGKKKLALGRRTLIMGVINVTPDSFSGDGLLLHHGVSALSLAQDLVDNGADILDIGAESSRPGSKRISAKAEMKRVMPVLKSLAKKISVPLSIDTTKSEVAHAALDSGVSIVNDISALRFDKKMLKIAARFKAGVILMHMQGVPFSMQKAPVYDDVVKEVFFFLDEAVKRVCDGGMDVDRIIVDPGIGFGKNLKHNIEILRRLSEFKSLGRPVLVGLSKKRFIGEIIKREVNQRQWGTAAAVTLAIANGADIVRVHDVGEIKQVAAVSDAIIRN